MDLLTALRSLEEDKLRRQTFDLMRQETEARLNTMAEALRQSREAFPLQMAAARREEAAKAAMQPFAQLAGLAETLGGTAPQAPAFRNLAAELYGKPAQPNMGMLPATGGVVPIGDIAARRRYNEGAAALDKIMQEIVEANKPGAREGAVARARAEAEYPFQEKLARLSAELAKQRAEGVTKDELAKIMLQHRLGREYELTQVPHSGFMTASSLLGNMLKQHVAAVRDPRLAETPELARQELQSLSDDIQFAQRMRDSFAATLPPGSNVAATLRPFNEIIAMLNDLYARLWNKHWGKREESERVTGGKFEPLVSP